ncbi:MAG: BTAD domain-containing putative transcriptional regulator, partial [Gemmatimonadota bacterium]
MIELRTLGALDLRKQGKEVRAVLQQPKRLGLLAYLAMATPRRFHRRDALLGMFWSELDQSHARAALRRALYFLRQALGDEAVVGRGDEELAVAESLWSDVGEFEAAVAAGDFRKAAELYRGDLLEGFYVSQAPEFERWLDLQRSHLREQAALALKALTEEAERNREWDAAAGWARRAAALSPYDEAAFRKTLSLLERTGDRSGVIKAYDEFAARLLSAYEIEPSPETRDYVAELRAQDNAPRATPSRPRESPAEAPLPLDPRSVAVLPFTVRGNSELNYLAEGMVDLLSTKLEGAGDLRTIDPRSLLSALAHRDDAGVTPETGRAIGHHFGAGSFLLGSIVAAGGQLEMSASLFKTDGDAVATAEARGEAESDIFAMVDELARQLLGGRSRAPRGRLTRLAALTTGSLPALKAYLRGEHDLRQVKYLTALDGFQQAISADPEFALAYYRMAAATAASAMPELAREAAAKANDLRDRLAPRDRILLDAQRAWLAGATGEAESLYQATVTNYPDDLEAWFLLGDLRFHSNPLRGRSVVEAKPAFERAVALDPDHVTALVHLVRIAALEGNATERDRLIARVIGLSPEGDRAMPMEALRAFAQRDRKAMETVSARLQEARPLVAGVAFADIALYSGNLAGAEQLGRSVMRTVRDGELRALGHIVLAHVLGALGRWKEARAELLAAEPTAPAWALEVRALFSALPFAPVDAPDLAADRAALDAWNPNTAQPHHHIAFAAHNGVHPHLREYLRGLLAMRADD